MIYVHIPFCRSFCTYCGFYSEVCPEGSLKEARTELFAEALKNELLARREEACGSPDTLYIGGGTPSVLPPSVLSSIVEAVNASRGTEKAYDEFTVEVNPDDIVSGGPRYAEFLLSLGVDRVSMGIQAFDDGLLKWMNRRHDAGEASEAYRILRQAGIKNVSLDLIFGIPRLDDRMWNWTLDRILNLPEGLPEHISAYQLSVEEGSVLERLVMSGRCREASEEECSRQYETLCSRLADAGYHHYEVSNFALPGHEAVHNSAYWAGRPYLGLGPGAHSFRVEDGSHVRSWNPPSVDKYIAVFGSVEGLEKRMAGYRKSEILTDEQISLEAVMLMLRTDKGMPEHLLRTSGDSAAIDRMLHAGNLVRLPDGHVRIPESKFFVSDSIIAAIA